MPIYAPTKVKWNERSKVGFPPKELWTMQVGPNTVHRTFLCRGEWSIFTSTVYSDGSGFEAEREDIVQAWAVIDGF